MTEDVRPFGFGALDETLDGGLPAGKLSVLEAPAESQSELLLERVSLKHDVLWVTTDRPAQEVTDQLQAAGDDHAPTAVAEASPSGLLFEGALGRQDVPEGGVVVVDPLDSLETGDRDALLEFLTHLRSAAADRDAAVLLHCRRAEDPPELRSLTLGRVDLVMELDLVFSTKKLESYLVVPKHRGGNARPEPLKLVLTDEVDVDTSRDIA